MKNKIEIFTFDISYIKNEIEKEILKKEKFKEMEIFKDIILFLTNEELIMYKSSNIIIKSLADFEDGLIKHNYESIYLTSSFLLTHKDIFNNNKSLYEYNFLIENNKIFLEYEYKNDGEDIYDYKIKKAISVFKNYMSEETTYKIILEEIINIFNEKIELAYNFLNNIINSTDENELNEDEIIKEIFFHIAEHKAYEEYNKWIGKQNDNRKK